MKIAGLWAPIGSIVLLTVASALFLSAGLNGPFVLDDYFNLKNLSDIHGASLTERIRWIFESGAASSTGRHLTFFSFALQAESWPNHPHHFKLVSLCIHSMNGVLLFVLLEVLRRKSAIGDGKGIYFCFIVTGLWLLHPILHSTVFYAVQRLVLLASFWILLGLIGYCYLVKKFDFSSLRASIVLLVYVVFTAGLGVLFKETTVIVPLFVLVLEVYILKTPGKYRHWVLAAFAIIPVTAFAMSLLVFWEPSSAMAEMRGMSFISRPFTEASVLLLYIWRILIPSPTQGGVLHDDIEILSFTSLTAWLGVAAVILILLACVVRRNEFTLLKLGILWFFLGHSLEASSLPLELYFEHRNYLPSVGIIAAFVASLVYLQEKYRNFAILLLVLFSSFWLWQSYSSKEIWSSEGKLFGTWYIARPESSRANHYWAIYLERAGNIDNAQNVYDEFYRKNPGNYHFASVRLAFLCRYDKVLPADVDELQRLASSAKLTLAANATITELNRVARDRKCANFSREDVMTIVERTLLNPNATHDSLIADAYYVLANIHVSQGRLDMADANLKKSKVVLTNLSTELYHARLLLAMGEYSEAKTVIQSALFTYEGAVNKNDEVRALIENLRKLADARMKIAPPIHGRQQS